MGLACVACKYHARNLDILWPLIYSYWQMKYELGIFNVLDWQSSLFWAGVACKYHARNLESGLAATELQQLESWVARDCK